jgi:hypothetical protein
MYADGRSDRLRISFADSAKWDAWQPAAGDVIAVTEGAARSGTMFVTDVDAADRLTTLQAIAAPASGFSTKSRSWETVYLTHLMQIVADDNGLSLEAHGIDDQRYSYVCQKDEGDFEFLSRVLACERCAMLVHDGKLVCYSEPYMEGQALACTIEVASGSKREYYDDKMSFARSARVESGIYAGEFVLENAIGIDLVYRDVIGATSDPEARRFAQGLLRDNNKRCRTGWIEQGFTEGIAPGRVITLRNDQSKSWDGPAFVTRVRHEQMYSVTTIYFRGIPEGY